MKTVATHLVIMVRRDEDTGGVAPIRFTDMVYCRSLEAARKRYEEFIKRVHEEGHIGAQIVKVLEEYREVTEERLTPGDIILT